MSKLQFYEKRTIRLQNVLIGKADLDSEDEVNFEILIEKMKTFIKVKGAVQVGPLIQYTRTFTNKNGEADMEISFMLQCNKGIHSVEKPFSFRPLLRVVDCLYCRYIGPEEHMKYAHDKIDLEAFESGIELGNECYMIYVDRDEEKETVVTDVFVPRLEKGRIQHE